MGLGRPFRAHSVHGGAGRGPGRSWETARMARNVLGEELVTCSADPVTGFYRTGCCDTGAEDVGVHVVCAEVTEEFLAFSRESGNDLSTPQPGFRGLLPGDRWCLCA